MCKQWLGPSGRAKEECEIPCSVVQVGSTPNFQLLKHVALEQSRVHVGLHALQS